MTAAAADNTGRPRAVSRSEFDTFRSHISSELGQVEGKLDSKLGEIRQKQFQTDVRLFGDQPPRFDGDDGIIGQLIRGQAKTQAQIKTLITLATSLLLAIVTQLIITVLHVHLGAGA